jgi:hypothetical protein
VVVGCWLQREVIDAPDIALRQLEARRCSCRDRVGCLDGRACVDRLLPRSEGSMGHLHDNAVAVEVGLDLGGGRLSGRHVDGLGGLCCEAGSCLDAVL